MLGRSLDTPTVTAILIFATAAGFGVMFHAMMVLPGQVKHFMDECRLEEASALL